jgi:hypothetical protein
MEYNGNLKEGPFWPNYFKSPGQPGIQIRIANSQNCEKLRMRSEFASLRFAEKNQSFASLSLRILDTQIRRIAKKIAESSQKVIPNFLKIR